MPIARWGLALLLFLYAAQEAFVAVYTTSLKFGWARAKGDLVRLAPLAHDTGVLQLVIGWIGVVLFFMTVWRLLRRQPALAVYAVAAVLSLVSWLIYKLGSVYDRVFTTAEQKFDYVLIDSSPVFATDDASTLAPKVDGTLFVVRSRYSSPKPVREALGLLYQRRARVLGVIFNQADTSDRSYYYYKDAEYYPTPKTT